MTRKQASKQNQVKVRVRGQTISLVLPKVYCGKTKVFSLGLANTPDNLNFAELKARQIEVDRLTGCFDETLEKYKFQNLLTFQSTPQEFLTLPEIYQRYIELRKSFVSPTTWKSTYSNTLNHLLACPYQSVCEALKVKNWLLGNRTVDTAKRVLVQLNAACDWACDWELLEKNPLKGKTKIKFSKKSKPQIHPFSSAEKDLILSSFENSSEFSDLLPIIKFFFLTGCRTGEALGLRWKSIMSDFSEISFEESIVIGQGGSVRKRGTKQSEMRTFPCNNQLKALLTSLKPKNVSDEQSVFVRSNGLPVTHQYLRNGWYGKGKSLGIVRQLAADKKIEAYRPQYNTRHTWISSCLEKGVSAIQVALWAGNSPEVIFRNYAGVVNKIAVPEL